MRGIPGSDGRQIVVQKLGRPYVHSENTVTQPYRPLILVKKLATSMIRLLCLLKTASVAKCHGSTSNGTFKYSSDLPYLSSPYNLARITDCQAWIGNLLPLCMLTLELAIGRTFLPSIYATASPGAGQDLEPEVLAYIVQNCIPVGTDRGVGGSEAYARRSRAASLA